MTKEVKDYTDQLVSDISFKGADLSYMKSLNAKFIDCDFLKTMKVKGIKIKIMH